MLNWSKNLGILEEIPHITPSCHCLPVSLWLSLNSKIEISRVTWLKNKKWSHTSLCLRSLGSENSLNKNQNILNLVILNGTSNVKICSVELYLKVCFYFYFSPCLPFHSFRIFMSFSHGLKDEIGSGRMRNWISTTVAKRKTTCFSLIT